MTPCTRLAHRPGTPRRPPPGGTLSALAPSPPAPGLGRPEDRASASERRPRTIRPASATASSAGGARTAAGTDGPTCGSAATSPGSTRVGARTSTRPSTSSASTPSPSRIRRCSSSRTWLASGSAPTGRTRSARRTNSRSKTWPTRPFATSSSGRCRTPSAFAPARPARRSPSAPRRPSPHWHRRCASAATEPKPSRTSSTGSCSACSPRTWGCSRTGCSPGCCAGAGRARTPSPRSRARCSAPMSTGGLVGFEPVA